MPRALASASRAGFAAGDTFHGRYVLGELIGEGGMGRVFRAEQRSLGRSVAMKFLRSGLEADDQMLIRFHLEVRAVSLLSHPNVVAVIDFGVAAPGGPFLVMEYVRGPSLTLMLHREGPLALSRATRMVDQILSALEAAHGAGVVHADIKSDNILVAPAEGGDEERVKIIDFGLARIRRAVDGGLDGEGRLSGTPEYLAPEVIRGEPPTTSADLYAVGVILFELLTGTTPFTGGSAMEIMNRQLTEEITPPSLRRPDRLIPPSLEGIVLRALAKDPAARFPDATAFRAALAEAAGRLNMSAISHCESCDRSRPVECCFCPHCGVSTADGRDVASTSESTTLDWGPADESVAAVRVQYRSIARAMVRGRAAEIADGYLELARALVRSGRIASAIAEIEEAIDVVSVGRGLHVARPAPSVSRLFAGLAGLHGLAGNRARARRAAIRSGWLARAPR